MSELEYEIEYERLAVVVNYFTAKWREGFAKRSRLQLVLKRLQIKERSDRINTKTRHGYYGLG